MSKKIDQNLFAVLSGFNNVYLYDISKQKKAVESFCCNLEEDHITDTFDIHQDRNLMAFANKIGTVSVFDRRNPKNCLKKIRNHLGAVTDLKIHHDKLYTSFLISFF
jgi:hypothetical protein